MLQMRARTYVSLRSNCPCLLSNFTETGNDRQIQQNFLLLNSMKICSVVLKLLSTTNGHSSNLYSLRHLKSKFTRGMKSKTRHYNPRQASGIKTSSVKCKIMTTKFAADTKKKANRTYSWHSHDGIRITVYWDMTPCRWQSANISEGETTSFFNNMETDVEYLYKAFVPNYTMSHLRSK